MVPLLPTISSKRRTNWPRSLRVDGGVFDEGDGLGVASDAHEQAEACLSDGPDVGLLGAVGDGEAVVAETDDGLGHP